MSLTKAKGGEVDVFVGIHIYIHMQGTHSCNHLLCGRADRAPEGRLFSCAPLSLLQKCVRSALSPSGLLPSLLPSVLLQEARKGDHSLEGQRSGRPSQVGVDSDPLTTTGEVIEVSVDHSTVVWHLK